MSADSFTPMIDGAFKAIDTLTSLALTIKENVIPAIVGIGTAATLTAGALAIALIGATGGLSLIIPVIAIGIGLLTKAIQDQQKAEAERVDQSAKGATLLREKYGEEVLEAKELERVSARINELQKDPKTRIIGLNIGNVAELARLNKEYEAHLAVINRIREAEDKLNRERQKANFVQLGKTPYGGTDKSLPGMGDWETSFNDSAEAMAKAWQAARDKTAEWATTIKEDLNKSIVTVIDNTVKAGKESVAWGNSLLSSLGQAREPAAQFASIMGLVTDKLGGLSGQAQETFLSALVAIEKDTQGTKNWYDGVDRLLGLLGQVNAAFTSAQVGQAMTSAFQPIIDGFVESEQKYLEWGDTISSMFSIGKTGAEKFTSTLGLIAGQMKGLDADQAVLFMVTAKGLKDAADKTGDWSTATDKLRDLLDKVKVAADKAADAQRWKDMFTEIGKGMAGPIDAYQKALNAPAGKTYGATDFRKVEIDIANKQRQIAEKEEQIRRIQGTSTSKKDNWTTPDPAAIEKLKRDIEELGMEIDESKQKMVAYGQTNADVANKSGEDFKKMQQDLGNVIQKSILAQEAQGEITSAQADQMLTQTEKQFGSSMSMGDKWARAYEQQMGRVKLDTEEARTAWVDMLAESSKAKDPAAELVKLVDDYVKKQNISKQVSKDQQKILEDNGELGNTAATNATKLATEQTKANDDLKTARDYLADSAKFLTDMVAKVWQVKVVIVGSSGGDGGTGDTNPNAHKEGDPAGQGMVYHWTGTVWGFIPDPNPGGNQSPALGPSAGPSMGDAFNVPAMIDAATPSRSAIDNLISDIQYALDKFRELSQDPRIKDMADTTSSVIGAIRGSVEMMAGLVKYTSPARANVDAAFSDMVYIAGRLINWGNDIIGAFDWEK